MYVKGLPKVLKLNKILLKAFKFRESKHLKCSKNYEQEYNNLCIS